MKGRLWEIGADKTLLEEFSGRVNAKSCRVKAKSRRVLREAVEQSSDREEYITRAKALSLKEL